MMHTQSISASVRKQSTNIKLHNTSWTFASTISSCHRAESH